MNLTVKVSAPSGHMYTIREQNGQDEEILTNLRDINNFMYLTNFLQAIIMDSSRYPGRKLTIQEVLDLPCLDRYAILMESRIFSIGEILEFDYTWPSKETFSYEENLGNYLLPYANIKDYTKEELTNILNEKPMAIPVYPKPELEKDIVITLKSNKRIKFNLLDGNGERYILQLPEDKTTRNSEFIARNLCLEVDGKWDRVSNFSLFSVKDMREIRSYIHSYDPSFNPMTEIENPNTGEKINLPVFAITSFFFPGDLEMMP